VVYTGSSKVVGFLRVMKLVDILESGEDGRVKVHYVGYDNEYDVGLETMFSHRTKTGQLMQNPNIEMFVWTFMSGHKSLMCFF